MFNHKSNSTPERASAINTEALFRRLLKEYKQPLYWHIRHIVGNHEDAQDALQEAFVRAYRNIDGLQDASTERAWLYRIATNEALRHVENEKPTLSVEERHDVADSLTPDYESLELALAAAIETLPPRQRAVFCMRYYDEMSYEDIARVNESNVKAVTANYHVAKEKIRQFLLAL